MQYKPKPKNSRASVISLALITVGALLMAASLRDFGAATGIIQTIAVLFLAGAIFVLIRYRLTEYIYSLCARDDAPDAPFAAGTDADPSDVDIVVEQKQGRRKPVMELRLSLDTLREIKRVAHGDDDRAEGVIRRYNYCVTFSPDEKYMLVFDEPTQGKIAVYAELSDEMAREIERIIK